MNGAKVAPKQRRAQKAQAGMLPGRDGWFPRLGPTWIVTPETPHTGYRTAAEAVRAARKWREVSNGRQN